MVRDTKENRANLWRQEAFQSLFPGIRKTIFWRAVFFCGRHDGIFERGTTRSPATYGICFFFSDFGKSVDVTLKGQPQADISHGSDKIIRVDSTTEANEGE